MTNQVSNKANEFCKHPIYDRYEANRNGVVRHIVNKKDIGRLSNTGYLLISVRCRGNSKRYLKHRFKIQRRFWTILITYELIID